jgi:YaiO family outer membrane protein
MRTTRCRWGCLLAGFLLALSAQAQEPAWQVEIGTGQESLSRGLPSWRQDDLALRHRWARRSVVELNTRRTERFDQSDRELGAALAWPLDARWDASVAASASPTHRVLPRHSLSGVLQRQLGDDWVAQVGLRSTRYDSDRATALTLGEWRAAAQLTLTRLAGVGSSEAARLQIDRYFGTRNRIGLLVSAGREIDNLGQGIVLISDARALVLLARWSLGRAWSVNGELGQTELGDRYRRRGGRLGVQLDF